MILIDAYRDIKKYITIGSKLPRYGYIEGYVASSGKPFGSGKTINAVVRLYDIFNKYNGRIINGKRVTICVYSNIDLNFPHIRINSIQEYVEGMDAIYNVDDYVYNFLLIDEIGAEFNNRNFSKNFTPDFLAKIVTQRHYKSTIFWTAQSFEMVDIIFRRMTTRLYTCSKWWRFFMAKEYLPRELEDINAEVFIKPIHKHIMYATDDRYNLYNTLSRFNSMKKDAKNGLLLSREEILEMFADSDKTTVSTRTKWLFRKRSR